ncbi:GAF domain-containing protein [Ruficoccus amylovorans]|uniref:histidine kinase n=1 Tax=Ruficoccus amylovorans TaxID=1804625 RepID=A0A842HGR1_9BACT|nr:GAF domain-containing protein [Ruficoccus amylovorans]MBC2594744.1 GAF domain-containing protein [Ruficoccus amylovorans]
MKTAQEDRSVLDSLYRISSLVSQTEDPREALELIIKNLLETLGATSASIALINPDTNRLEIEVYRGLPKSSEEIKLALGSGVTGWVALHGEPVLIEDVRFDPRYITLKQSIRSEMAAPMILQGLTVGVVNVDSEQVAAFDEKDLKLLVLLTSEATKVVGRLWLINQLKEKAGQLQALISAGQQLVATRDQPTLLQSIAREARRLMDCRYCAIMLLTPDGKSLKLHALEGPDGSVEYQEELDLEQSTIGVALKRNKQISVSDLARTEEHHFVPFVQSDQLRSMLTTPIVVGKEVIGVLNAYTDVSHRFNNDEKRLFTTLASLGGVALENSRLYSRVFATEESLRRNERLTTLGLLAAEIAHEIRNPLTVIKLLFEALDLEFPAGDPRQQDVSVITEKIVQLEEIVSRVLNFGKSRSEMHSPHDLKKLVEDSLVLLRLKLEQSKVHLAYEAPREPLMVEVHKGQIQQVILNLIINAVEAMPEGGVISVILGTQLLGERTLASVTVKDAGGGVPEKMRGKIFESFLTGKSQGTGLGLAISRQILKSHRGELELLETGPAGTTFRFLIPLLQSD